jgi:hypothetical protein
VLLPETRAALDVGEEEGDGFGWERHDWIQRAQLKTTRLRLLFLRHDAHRSQCRCGRRPA